ncbi:MAG: glucose-1-phosphate adenylyltransferase [Lachnospiraceae bacterium]|nr:glucose-1-phosphate adenylyltransferase [Lachnospiraceae bacterium]
MAKKEMVAMLLAGGQGSRLGVLTEDTAKPAVSFGGKYRIIDFPLSNCINSGVDTVGVLTQYRHLRLNTHIGIGIPWDLDRNHGGVTLLPPYETNEASNWYSGTANAIYQNLEFIEEYSPEYVLILGGDHIYKMDYQVMLDFHKSRGADITIACMPVPWEEASRFGVVIADENGSIKDFEEKPAHPSSNLASMGIYIFSASVLKEALIALKDQPGCDFGMHVIPYIHEKSHNCYAYEFNGYWKDVGTLGSYWQANMELLDDVPEFNLYEEFWKVYTKNDIIRPQYLGPHSRVTRSIVGEGAVIMGEVSGSVIGAGVEIGEDARVTDSIIMENSVIGAGTVVDKAIIAENTVVGVDCVVGEGEYADNVYNPKVYAFDLVTVSENSSVPDGVRIGRNTAISGKTLPEDYKNGKLAAGQVIIKEVGPA